MPTAQSGSTLPIRIIRIGDEMTSIGCAQELLKHKFYASAIFFPTVARGEAGLRVSLTASHQADEIESFVAQSKSSWSTTASPNCLGSAQKGFDSHRVIKSRSLRDVSLA